MTNQEQFQERTKQINKKKTNHLKIDKFISITNLIYTIVLQHFALSHKIFTTKRIISMIDMSKEILCNEIS